MRGAFGLVGLLVCAGIIAILWSNHTEPVLREGKKAQEKAAEIAGVDAAKSITVVKTEVNGKPCLDVTMIDPQGPMAKRYGFMLKDQIVDLGIYETDPAFLLDAYRRSEPITVLRNGQRITLPQTAVRIPTH